MSYQDCSRKASLFDTGSQYLDITRQEGRKRDLKNKIRASPKLIKFCEVGDIGIMPTDHYNSSQELRSEYRELLQNIILVREHR